MDFKQLETYIAVVELGSFSAAANYLYLSQPTVSVHVKQLENELGTELINRTTKSIEMTIEGREFYNYAKSILDIVDNAKNTLSNKKSNVISITASSIPSSHVLPQIMKAYQEENPEVLFELTQTDTIRATDRILKGQGNVGFVGSRMRNSDLNYEKIYEDKLLFVTPYNDYFLDLKEKGATVKDLIKEPIIQREKGSGTLNETNKILESLDLDTDSLNIAAIINDNETIINCVKAGIGISIISEYAVSDDIENNELLAFDIDTINTTRYFYMITRKNTILSQQMNQFVNFVRDYSENNDILPIAQNN